MKYLLMLVVMIGCLNAIDFRGLEPSGVTKLNGVTYIVSDNGKILVIDAKGKEKVYEMNVKKKYRDFEGITTDGTLLFVAIEGKDAIMTLNTKLDVLSIVKVKRKFNGKKVIHKKGNGLESIAFLKKDGEVYSFVVANQSKKFKGKDKTAIMKVELDGKRATIVEYKALEHIDIAALCVYNDLIYSISDKEDKLIVFDMNFNVVKTHDIGSGEQEGLFIKDDIMYIADDEGDFYTRKLP
jgi:hypothetical protein